MDRKNRVWQIVLLVLLIVAIIIIGLITNQWSISKETLSSTAALLTAEQDNSATLQTALDSAKADYEAASEELKNTKASMEKLNSDYEAANEELKNSKASIEKLNSDFESSQSETSAAQEELKTATAKVSELEAAAEESAAKLKELETALADKNEEIAALNSSIQEKDTLLANLAAPEISVVPSETPDPLRVAADNLEALLQQISAKQVELEALSGNLETDIPVGGEPSDDKTIDAEPSDIEIPYVDIAAIQAHIDAVLSGENTETTDDERLLELDSMEFELSAQLEQLNAAAEHLTGNDAALAELSAKLGESNSNVTRLTSELAASKTTISDLDARLAELQAQSEVDASELVALEDSLRAATADAEAKAAELEAQKIAYESSLEEIRAYLLSRELQDGEAHSASAIDNEIHIAADGVSAVWNYANTSASGNAVILSVMLEDKTIYTSQLLQPGETIESFTLEEPLSPGEYEGVAITGIYDEAGNALFTNRVPVALIVSES